MVLIINQHLLQLTSAFPIYRSVYETSFTEISVKMTQRKQQQKQQQHRGQNDINKTKQNIELVVFL